MSLLEYLYVLAIRKRWLVLAAAVGALGGLASALSHGPVFESQAIIAPREDGHRVPSFSGNGFIGSMVASQLNLPSGSRIDKIEMILDSREFHAAMVEQNELLPRLYEYRFPRDYETWYDTVQNRWREDFVPRDRLHVAEFLRSSVVRSEVRKNNTLLLTVTTTDSSLTVEMLSTCVSFLDRYMQSMAKTEAEANVQYLEKRLSNLSDPLLRERLHSLIAAEIEEEMLVNRGALNVVESGYTVKNWSELYTLPVAYALISILLASIAVVVHHTIRATEWNESDRQFIAGIRNAFKMRRGRG